MTNQEIIELYKQCYNVSEVMKIAPYGRAKLVGILEDAGVYEGLNGPNYLSHKTIKMKSLMMDKYGVENISQLGNTSIQQRNNIPYTPLHLGESYKQYQDQVRKLTNRIVRSKKNKLDIPEICFYTGITFRDVDTKDVNPNDPLKRTVDHKHPVLMCFIDGWSVEEAAAASNLVFVLRFVNSVKANTTHESFLPIALKIRERLHAEL